MMQFYSKKEEVMKEYLCADFYIYVLSSYPYIFTNFFNVNSTYITTRRTTYFLAGNSINGDWNWMLRNVLMHVKVSTQLETSKVEEHST